MSNALDQALQRLLVRFPPKHPDRKNMRPYERQKERERKTNSAPIVCTNGWQSRRRGGVNWDKQDHIPVGTLDTGLWGPPPSRGMAVPGKKNKKGKKG